MLFCIILSKKLNFPSPEDSSGLLRYDSRSSAMTLGVLPLVAAHFSQHMPLNPLAVRTACPPIDRCPHHPLTVRPRGFID